MPNKIPVLVLFAPTASGKTDLLLSLFANKDEARVISADSMQVYREMNVGTAKPTPAEQKILPHHLIDIKNPDEQYSVAEFVDRADSLCKSLYAEGKLPIICGGTGFYIRAFLLGLPSTPASDPAARKALQEELLERGPAEMWKKLLSLDPDSAKKIDPKDSYRVLRALEIVLSTGKPRAAFAQSLKLREQYDFTTIILERDRDDLYKRIEARVDKMFQAGLEAEARDLMARYKKEDPGMQAIGYREFFETDAGGPPLSVEEIKERIKRDSKKYAKKQYVFTRGIPGAETIRVAQNNDTQAELAKIALPLLDQI